MASPTLEDYEDDFEPETDVQKRKHGDDDEVKAYKSEEDNDIISPPIRVSSPVEKKNGQLEMESPSEEKTLNDEASDNEYETDSDAYNFTEDQKRAMMELMVQKQEDSDLLDEEPPEYNVKGRLEQLNAELANDPAPVEGDRELKVGFKSEIIDLVAPPPDFSDDESQPNSVCGEPQPHGAEPNPDKGGASWDESEGNSQSDNQVQKTRSWSDSGEEMQQKQFVIEREGNFEVLSAEELTNSERALLFIPEEVEESKSSSQRESKKKETTQSFDSQNSSNNNAVMPKPPSRPRPNTAATSSRRNLRLAQSPRPKSAGQSGDLDTFLDNFSYNSPYAMTPNQKEQAKEVARKAEEERMERERRKREESEERRKENESAFESWLRAKRDGSRRKQNADDDNQRSEQERKEGNEEAYKTWMKEKRVQGKKDKLLKKRQQQDMMEGFYIRPREECDKAFREWLRKKNADLRKQQETEKHRSRMYRTQVKRTKKTQVLLKAMRESQAFRYVDYYGYRF